MKKSTVVLLIAVAVLALVVLLLAKRDDAPPAASIKVAGYAPEDKLEEQKDKGLLDGPVDIEYPVDEVIVVRGKETVRLVREGEGKDLSWSLKTPVDAPAVKYNVEKMIKLFETETASVHAKTLKKGDLRPFGLEPENRLQVTLKLGGTVWNGVDFIIGDVVETRDASAEASDEDKDTWVMKPGDEKTVYRIAGKDLRTPFEQELTELRDKKLFTVKPEDLVEVVIADPSGQQVVLTGERKEEEPKPDPAKKEEPKKEEPAEKTFKVTWQLTKPEGVKGDKSIDSVARSLANLRTREFVPAEEAPESPLGDKVWKVTGKTHDGKTLSVSISDKTFKPDPKGHSEQVWAQVEGKKELLKLDKWAAGNLRKSVADLQDKAVFEFTEEQVTGVTFSPEEGKPVVVEKREGKWVFVVQGEEGPTTLPFAADPEAAIKQIVTARVQRYAKAGELEVALGALARPDFTSSVRVGDKTHSVAFGVKLLGELSGKVDTSKGSATLTGKESKFSSEAKVGMVLEVEGQTRTVKAIASDTELEVDAAFDKDVKDKQAKLPANKDERNQRWARVTIVGGTAGQPFLVQDWTATRFRKKLDELRAKKVFTFDKSDLQRIEIAWPGGENKVTLERPPEGKALELIDAQVPEGKKPKKIEITKIESTLTSLRVKKFVEDKAAPEIGLDPATDAYVIKAILASGDEYQLIISQQTDGTDPYATSVGGPLAGTAYTLNKYQADNLKKEPKDLVE